MPIARLLHLAKWAWGKLRVILHHYWLSRVQIGRQELVFASICIVNPDIQTVQGGF